jgi:hypothetical protein
MLNGEEIKYHAEGPSFRYDCISRRLIPMLCQTLKASAALLASRFAASSSFSNFMLERDALLVILTVNQLHLFATWQFAHIISDLRLEPSFF